MNRFTTNSFFIALAFSAWDSLPATSHAQSILRPAGLNPGDEYRLAFVTEGKRNASSSDIADYNSFVTDEASASNSLVSGLQTDWRAIASTDDDDATENTNTDPIPVGDTGVPIYLVDGQTRIADHYDNMWDGDSAGFGILLAPLNLTQYGLAAEDPINNVWTGTDYYGVAGGFGGPLGTLRPTLGASVSSNGRWINNNFNPFFGNSETLSLYAISSVLIAIPEPTTCTLALAALCLVMGRRRSF